MALAWYKKKKECKNKSKRWRPGKGKNEILRPQNLTPNVSYNPWTAAVSLMSLVILSMFTAYYQKKCTIINRNQWNWLNSLGNDEDNFTRESSYCFQRVLAIAILSVCPSVRLSVTRVDQSKTVQARITKSSPLAVWKTLVSGTVKLFHKFKGGHSERGR